MKHGYLIALLALSAAGVSAADLDGCAKEHADYDLTPQFVFETLPTIDLTASLRRSLSYAEQELASMQASRARGEQRAEATTEAESTSRTTSYVVSSQDSRALASAVAAQPKPSRALSPDAVSSAAQIGVKSAAFETTRLLTNGTATAEAKRAGQAKGLIAAAEALKQAGATPTAADLARLKSTINGQVEAGSDAVGVAAWARSSTSSVQRSLAQEQAQRFETSRTRTSSASATLTDSAQSQQSQSDTLTNDAAFSVPVRIDMNRDLYQVWYPAFIGIGQTTKIEWRASAFRCADRARIMAEGGWDALKFVEIRDRSVVADVERVYALGREGRVVQFLNGVAALAADPRLMSKAAALRILYLLGTVGTPNAARAMGSPTTFPAYVMEAIGRQIDVIEAFDQRQRSALRQPYAEATLPERMPGLARPTGPVVPLSAQERVAYAYFTSAQQTNSLYGRALGW